MSEAREKHTQRQKTEARILARVMVVRNFVEVREKFFPPVFIEFLESLGINSRKDGEVVHYRSNRPACTFTEDGFIS